MSIAATLKNKTLELRKNRDDLASALQMTSAMATAFAKERGLKGGNDTVTDEDATRAVQKSIKMVRDTLELAPTDERSQRELAVLESLLPVAASDDELNAEIAAFKAAHPEANIKMMGMAMSHMVTKFGPALDKGKVSGMIKTALTA